MRKVFLVKADFVCDTCWYHYADSEEDSSVHKFQKHSSDRIVVRVTSLSHFFSFFFLSRYNYRSPKTLGDIKKSLLPRAYGRPSLKSSLLPWETTPPGNLRGPVGIAGNGICKRTEAF